MEKLAMPEQPLGRGARMRAYLEREVWPFIPPEIPGRTLTKEEDEELLGFSPDGYSCFWTPPRSLIICALNHEPELERSKSLIERATLIAIGTPVLVEAGLVLAGRKAKLHLALDDFQHSIAAQIFDFRAKYQVAALDALLGFGKGRHPARRNFDDCLSYSFAADHKLPLADKGNGFGLTDLPLLLRLAA